MKRGGRTIAVEDSEAGPWNKDWQDRRLANQMYQALPFEAVGVYHHIRSIAAAHGRDGAIRLAGRHDAPATLKQVAEVVALKMGGPDAVKRARAVLKAIVLARLLVLDGKQVLYVANAAEEWAPRRAWSDSPDAVRQREHRERKRQEAESPTAEPPPPPPMTETLGTEPKTTACAENRDGQVVTSGVTPLPIYETIPIRRGEEMTSHRIGIPMRQEEAARTQPNRFLSGGGGGSADFYAQEPVALWCRLCGEPGNIITERTAMKYLRLWGRDAFMSVCAEFRDDLERDRAAGRISDAGKLGSSKIVEFENRRRAAQGLPELPQRGPRREPVGFHVPDPVQGCVRSEVEAWAGLREDATPGQAVVVGAGEGGHV